MEEDALLQEALAMSMQVLAHAGCTELHAALSSKDQFAHYFMMHAGPHMDVAALRGGGL